MKKNDKNQKIFSTNANEYVTLGKLIASDAYQKKRKCGKSWSSQKSKKKSKLKPRKVRERK